MNSRLMRSPLEILVADRLPQDGQRVTIRIHGMSFFTGMYVFEKATALFYYLGDDGTERSTTVPPLPLSQVVEWCGASGKRDLGGVLVEGPAALADWLDSNPYDWSSHLDRTKPQIYDPFLSTPSDRRDTRNRPMRR